MAARGWRAKAIAATLVARSAALHHNSPSSTTCPPSAPFLQADAAAAALAGRAFADQLDAEALAAIGPAAAALLTGSLVVEQVFGLPGVGRYFVQGAINRDYTLVMGMVVFYAVLIVLLNLLVDLAYGCLDPRIRHE